MILANSTWGGWLDQCKVPGIYRSQASMLPGVKVRMGTKAVPHAGMGVPQYTWSTSPLRRYVDLVNQWQIIACARHGHTAALAAPFRPKDASLFSVISAFDAAYAAYNDFQRAIERYWALRWLTQNEVGELAGHGDEGRPGARRRRCRWCFRASGTESLPRGVHVRVRLNAHRPADAGRARHAGREGRHGADRPTTPATSTPTVTAKRAPARRRAR